MPPIPPHKLIAILDDPNCKLHVCDAADGVMQFNCLTTGIGGTVSKDRDPELFERLASHKESQSKQAFEDEKKRRSSLKPKVEKAPPLKPPPTETQDDGN